MLGVLWCLGQQIFIFIMWLIEGGHGFIEDWLGVSISAGILGQLLLEYFFDTRLVKSGSIEEFCNIQQKVYVFSIILDLSMMQVLGQCYLGRNPKFILQSITWLYILWVIHLLLRDILSLIDIKDIKAVGFTGKKKVITASVIDKRLINNKYTLWYMKDKDKRVYKVHKEFKKGAKYEVEIIKGRIGEYIVDYKIR